MKEGGIIATSFTIYSKMDGRILRGSPLRRREREVRVLYAIISV